MCFQRGSRSACHRAAARERPQQKKKDNEAIGHFARLGLGNSGKEDVWARSSDNLIEAADDRGKKGD